MDRDNEEMMILCNENDGARDGNEKIVDLELIHKTISSRHYWSDSVWMELMAEDFFIDHDYCSFKNDDSLYYGDDLGVSIEPTIKYYDDNGEFPGGPVKSIVDKTNDDSGIDTSSSSFLSDDFDDLNDDDDGFSFRRDRPPKTYYNKRKHVVESAKRPACKRSREVLISDESPVIEGEFERRVTRLLVKSSSSSSSSEDKPAGSCVEDVPGKLVWGCFRSGWWPALIIKAEDAGMISTPGKMWVSWIGESRISELRDKLVEPFSSSLQTRLDSLIADSKAKATSRKMKDDACYQTILLLKKQFTGSALMKPYATWIKNNIIPHRDKLDDLKFYPYPDAMADTLSELKRQNAAKTQKYLRDRERLQKAEQKAQSSSSSSARKVEKPEKPIEQGGINIMDQKPGMIVWAKMCGYSLWPCVIMHYEHLNKKQPNVAHQWVMWYGDYKYSQVEYHQILDFPAGIEKMGSKIRTTKEELFLKAVLQSSKDYCDPLGYPTETWTLDSALKLFYESDDRHKLRQAPLMQPNDEDLYSQTIKKQLRKQINNQPVCEERRKLIENNQKFRQVLSGEAKPESLCITCFGTEQLQPHPFFHASMCETCLEEFRPKVFAYGDDGKCFFCTLCGGDDQVAMCDSMNCPRVFCTACIKYILSRSRYEEILEQHPWCCFLCESGTMQDSLCKIRRDWQKRLMSVYRVSCDETKSKTTFEGLEKGRKIRVLSLFDGIGTGLVVLKKLGIDVQCYYASEIDPDSMQVSYFNHGDEIKQLGDVRNIDEKVIREIGPIDLLIGGSPCNELSLANPRRRGLDDSAGTGVLFYDYCRVKRMIEKHNKKRHLFWLFENVASMPTRFRNQISANLGREPHFIDSADFSAMHRPRLYWGNLPFGPYEAQKVELQNVLRKQCKRQALVKKIMTVTTRSNSLNQTKENLKPVLMNGKRDMLWVTELEEIFGFPIHYTDANLQKTRRLQLLGKAWSVQTVVAILRPMFYF